MKLSILDTDILSEFFRANRNVVSKVGDHIEEYGFINLSIITYYEIRAGLLYKDAKKQLARFQEFADQNRTTIETFDNWETQYYMDSLMNPNAEYIRNDSIVVIDDRYKFKNVDWKKDYAIGVWRGEWAEYYFSWSDSYDSNNYSWWDGFEALLLATGIGLLPIVIWWFSKSRIRKKLV